MLHACSSWPLGQCPTALHRRGPRNTVVSSCRRSLLCTVDIFPQDSDGRVVRRISRNNKRRITALVGSFSFHGVFQVVEVVPPILLWEWDGIDQLSQDSGGGDEKLRGGVGRWGLVRIGGDARFKGVCTTAARKDGYV